MSVRVTLYNFDQSMEDLRRWFPGSNALSWLSSAARAVAGASEDSVPPI